MGEVTKQQQRVGDEIMDFVDVEAGQLRVGSEKSTCRQCLRVLEKQTSCTCEQPSQRPPTRDEVYDFVESEHHGPCSVKMGEVVEEMPNSFATCVKVLEDLKQQACIGTEREWVTIGCDGQPYDLISKLIDDKVVCSQCESTLNNDEVSTHSELHQEEPPTRSCTTGSC